MERARYTDNAGNQNGVKELFRQGIELKMWDVLCDNIYGWDSVAEFNAPLYDRSSPITTIYEDSFNVADCCLV